MEHVSDRGWQGVRNGERLELMIESGFAGLMTVDKSLSFQNRIAGTMLFVVVLSARSNRRVDLLPLIPDLMRSLAMVQAGQVVVVGRAR